MNTKRIKLLESFIEEEPENPFNRYALAMEYYESEPSRAAEMLQALTQEFPDYLPTYYKAAMLFWNLDDLEEAKRLFESGIDLATRQDNQKTLGELKTAFLNFQFECD